jgi:hypothetical protein
MTDTMATRRSAASSGAQVPSGKWLLYCCLALAYSFPILKLDAPF